MYQPIFRVYDYMLVYSNDRKIIEDNTMELGLLIGLIIGYICGYNVIK